MASGSLDNVEKYAATLSNSSVKANAECVAITVDDEHDARNIIDGFFKAGILEVGAVTGAAYKTTHFTRREQKRGMVEIRPCLPMGWDGDVPESRWEEGYIDAYDDVPASRTDLEFVTSKKWELDIAYNEDKKTLTIRTECLDEDVMRKAVAAKVSANPDSVLPQLVGKTAAKNLSDAFKTTAALKPLTVQDSLDQKKMKASHKAADSARHAIEAAVASAGLVNILGAKETSELVKKKSGLKISF